MRTKSNRSLRLFRRALIGSLLISVLTAWGCTSDDAGTPLATAGRSSGPPGSTSTTSGSTAVGGGVSTASATPTPVPTTTPTTAPTPTPVPTATPTPIPAPTPFALQVTVTIATPSINLAPQTGTGTALYPYTTTVSADVLMSNGTHQNGAFVNWDTSDHAIATVDSTGLVTAGSTKGGTVTIIGTSKDLQAVGTVNLTVTTQGGAQLTVN